MRVLIACEFSGTVRDAFAAKGHDAWSCDLLPSVKPGQHIQGDAIVALRSSPWDLVIAHPPCTYLTCTGNKWFYHPDDKGKPIAERRPHPRFPDRLRDRQAGIDFFKAIAACTVPKLCIENPVGVMSTLWRKPDQIIQPFQFGHVEAKKTCLWLRGLPKLTPTKIVEPVYTTFKSGKRVATWYVEAASLPPQERMLARSKTFQGIADAMAEQWGKLC